jgi:hypothetical protein
VASLFRNLRLAVEYDRALHSITAVAPHLREHYASLCAAYLRAMGAVPDVPGFRDLQDIVFRLSEFGQKTVTPGDVHEYVLERHRARLAQHDAMEERPGG